MSKQPIAYKFQSNYYFDLLMTKCEFVLLNGRMHFYQTKKATHKTVYKTETSKQSARALSKHGHKPIVQSNLRFDMTEFGRRTEFINRHRRSYQSPDPKFQPNPTTRIWLKTHSKWGHNYKKKQKTNKYQK